MKKISFLLFSILLSCIAFAQTVKIGEQVWMTKNLNVSKFRNGDYIPQAKTIEEWNLAGNNEKPAWCYYNNNVENGTKYGKLYNWYAVNDARGLAPAGYHIPTDYEWEDLVDYLGGEYTAGEKMKSKTGWIANSGTNTNGFSFLPGGDRYYDGVFWSIGEYGFLWSSTVSSGNNAWGRYLYSYDGSVGSYSYSKTQGLSVRCLMD